jgi:hypothetical protein
MARADCVPSSRARNHGFQRCRAVRFFAVGNKQRVADVVSYQTYHDKMAALMDAAFPARGSFVQVGVDDVASHLFRSIRPRRRTRSSSSPRTSASRRR